MSGPIFRTRPDLRNHTLNYMSLSHRTQPAIATPQAAPPRPRRRPTSSQRRFARRAVRIITYPVLTGAATTAGQAAVTAVIWWIHNH